MDNLKQEYEDGATGHILSVKYNIPISTIYARLRSAGVKMRHQQRSLNLDMFINLNEIGAYWLGFIFADGYLKAKEGRTVIKLNSRDKEIIEKFAADLGYPKWYTYDNMTVLSISNRPLFEILTQYLGGNKQYKRSIPPMTPNLLPHFVRGVLEGDGYIGTIPRKNRPTPFKRLDITFQHQETAIEFVKLIKSAINLQLNGPYARDKNRKSTTTWAVMASSNTAMKFGEWIYANPIRTLERKHKRFLEWTSNKPQITSYDWYRIT